MATTVTVNEGHCVHMGKDRYNPGDTFDTSEKEAKRLIGKGAVAPARGGKKPQAPEAKAPKGGDK